MNRTAHFAYILILTTVVVAALCLIGWYGLPYYRLGIEDRFFHPVHGDLKPSGPLGHGFGIIGSLFMLLGVSMYMVRKRLRSLGRIGVLKHWLEFHIFLCTLGPILVLYHTSFKFGGLVAVSFWSMVAVVASGVIGRFIYIRIPRSIEGRELSLSEVRDMASDISGRLKEVVALDPDGLKVLEEATRRNTVIPGGNLLTRYFRQRSDDRTMLQRVRETLERNNADAAGRKQVLTLVRRNIALNHRIDRLAAMQNLFRYWHVAHLPFALVMLIIMIIHVAVTIVFGYRWIF